MSTPRNYSTDEEIHMEPGQHHESLNSVGAYPSELESALARIANSDASRLKGTNHEIATRRMEANNERRYQGVDTEWKKY